MYSICLFSCSIIYFGKHHFNLWYVLAARHLNPDLKIWNLLCGKKISRFYLYYDSSTVAKKCIFLCVWENEICDVLELTKMETLITMSLALTASPRNSSVLDRELTDDMSAVMNPPSHASFKSCQVSETTGWLNGRKLTCKTPTWQHKRNLNWKQTF